MSSSLPMKLLALAILPLSACSVGPDYQTPEVVSSIEVGSDYQPAELSLTWWESFDDVALNQLIQRALTENRTLLQAQVNVERAYAVFRDVRNDGLPKGTLDVGYQASQNGTLATNDDDVITRGYSTGAGLSWDLDLFGRLRRASEAAEAQAQQAEHLWHDAQVRLISQVATTYSDYRGAQLRLQVAEQNLANLQQSRDIVKARLDVGMASELEVAQIDVQLFQVQATLPEFRSALYSAEATLSALLAYEPGQLQLDEEVNFPELKRPVEIIDGENYLRYRSDVASRERLLAARTAEIGVATADLYPNLSVGGFLGFLSNPGLTLGSETESWSVAPTLSWQAGDLGSVQARIRQSEASTRMALAEFEQAVFDAINEMQLSLHRYNLSREQQLSTEQQLVASKKAVTIAQQQYSEGSSEFLDLLDTERELLRSRDEFAQIQQQNFNRLVDIYRSFSGAIRVD